MTEPLVGCHTLQCALRAGAANANTQTAAHIHIVDYRRHCDADPGYTRSRKLQFEKMYLTLFAISVLNFLIFISPELQKTAYF